MGERPKMLSFLLSIKNLSLAGLLQKLTFQTNAHCLNGPCAPGSLGGGVWHEVDYKWNSPKEANHAVGYGPWAHVGTLGASITCIFAGLAWAVFSGWSDSHSSMTASSAH